MRADFVTALSANKRMRQPDSLLSVNPFDSFAGHSGLGGSPRMQIHKTRVLKSGVLRALATQVNVQSGNVAIVVYREGGTVLAPTLVRQWDSGSQACPLTDRFRQIGGDPALSVALGEDLWLGVATDNTVVTFNRTGFAAGGAAFPDETWWEGSVIGRLTVVATLSSWFVLPNTVDLLTASGGSNRIQVLGKIADA